MARLYGWGSIHCNRRSPFKIQHWPFSGFFLVLGLAGTEAVIFFLPHLSHHTKMWIGPSYILNLPEWMRDDFKKGKEEKQIRLHNNWTD